MPSPAAQDVTRQEQPRLYNLLGKSLHLARHSDAEAEDRRQRRAERLRDRAQPEAICRHRHHGSLEFAQRPGDRGGARPRAHPHPQRRRADDGDRGRSSPAWSASSPNCCSGASSISVTAGARRLRRRSSWSTSSSSSSESSSSDSGGGDRKSSGGGAILIIILAVVLIALAWALSQLVRLALSRSRELLADAGSVELTKNPDAMISALRKIEGRGELPGATSAVMELCLDNPREGFSDLFATHPSVEARVQALVKYAGGHYVGPAGVADASVGRAGGPVGNAGRAADAPPPAGTRGASSGSLGQCRRSCQRLLAKRAGRALGQSSPGALGPQLEHALNRRRSTVAAKVDASLRENSKRYRTPLRPRVDEFGANE